MYILCLSVCFFKFNNQFRKSTHHSSYEPREGFIMVKDKKCFLENFRHSSFMKMRKIHEIRLTNKNGSLQNNG